VALGSKCDLELSLDNNVIEEKWWFYLKWRSWREIMKNVSAAVFMTGIQWKHVGDHMVLRRRDGH
jgi:hypothetical protein